MSPQEEFDIVAKHLLTQNARSVRQAATGIMCMYRGPAGTKCAVGILIPDETYRMDFEGMDFHDVLQETGLQSGYPFYTGLRDLHDCLKPEQWREHLKVFAERHQLTFNS